MSSDAICFYLYGIVTSDTMKLSNDGNLTLNPSKRTDQITQHEVPKVPIGNDRSRFLYKYTPRRDLHFIFSSSEVSGFAILGRIDGCNLLRVSRQGAVSISFLRAITSEFNWKLQFLGIRFDSIKNTEAMTQRKE